MRQLRFATGMDRQQMNFSNDTKRKRQRPASATARIDDAVSNRLRSYYAEIAQQEVPRHLLDLLDALDEAGAEQEQPSEKK